MFDTATVAGVWLRCQIFFTFAWAQFACQGGGMVRRTADDTRRLILEAALQMLLTDQ
jgi:hypothetical protein